MSQGGDLLGYGAVYYHPEVVANVLSFFNMTNRFKSAAYDNTVKDAFRVTQEDDTIIEFGPSPGLYYYNFEESIKQRQEREMITVEQTLVVQSVEEIKWNTTKTR